MFFRRLWPIGMLAASLLLQAAGAAAPVVATSSGPVRGAVEEGVEVFRGIPYAAPPVGALRWRPPQPPPAWPDVREATRFGPVCPQDLRAVSPDMAQSEDCLTLNVYAPAADRALPVMVWIHGGSFRWGAGSLPAYDGVTFARQGVVLVTLNYRLERLGRFGHPALTRAAAAGEGLANYGLMDQVAALRWVQENIAAFGGDPGRVTIFGYSAGGVSVNFLMATPSARGLFQRAISQSGGIDVVATRRLREKAGRFTSLEADGLEFAASVGIADDDRAAERLRALTAAQILAYPQKDSSMNPVVDGVFVPESIGQVFREGRQHPVPYLAGANSWEASLIRPFKLPMAAILAGVSVERAREVYGALGDLELQETYFGDVLFLAPAWTLAARMAAANTPAWLYYYSYVDEHERGTVPGAAHGAEVSHLFRRALRPGKTLTAADIAVSEPLRRYWIEFARSANPNVEGLPAWPPFTARQPAIMEFGERPVVRPALFAERMAFHQSLID
jgi:para-nitrobenzyl esterase